MPKGHTGRVPQSKQPQFRIKVLGAVDPSWADSLGGMILLTEGEGGSTTVTTLSGSLPDQAALLGVLNLIYDLGLPVLSVEQLSEGSLSNPQDNQPGGDE